MRFDFKVSLFQFLALFAASYALAIQLDETVVKIGDHQIRLPHLDEFPRLDGKSQELDDTVATMAKGARNRVVAFYGTEADLGLLLQGEKPSLSRTITIQSAVLFEDKDMPLSYFPKFKNMLKDDLKKADKSIEVLLEEIENSSSDALTKQNKIETIIQYGNVALLGIFSETDNSLCQSILAKVRSETPNGHVEAVQASSISLVYLGGKLLTIYVSQQYDSIKDLQWTRETALRVRDELLAANAKEATDAPKLAASPAQSRIPTPTGNLLNTKGLLDLAHKGDSVAQYKIALMHSKGEGLPKNHQEAFKWAAESAAQGNADAQYLLGLIYTRGDLGQKNLRKAVDYFEMAGRQGHINAQFNLGLMYLNGEGIPKDTETGFMWMSKAAEQGDATAQFNLAMMYAKGDGVQQDLTMADNLVKKAAEQGNPRAIQAIEKAKSFEKNPASSEALQHTLPFIRDAAAKGNAEAQYNLGLMYSKGDNLPKSGELAHQWLSKSAEQGYTNAEFALGILYLTGDGIPRNASEAAKLLQRAAAKDHPDAQFNLGLMYIKGDGVKKNIEEATRLFREAAKHGHKEAIRLINHQSR